MSRTVKVLGGIALLGVLVVIGFYGYQRFFAAPAQTNSARSGDRARDSNIVTVTRRDLVRTVAAFGEVFPKEEIVLRFKTGGIVQEILVREGERVQKNQILARLSNAQQELKLLQAKNAYEAAKISAPPNEIQIRELEYKIAQEEYEYTILKAPWDGEVIALHVQEGDSVTHTTDIVTLLNRDEMFVTVDIDEVDIREIALGQRARVMLEAYPDLRFTAEVTAIDYRAVAKGSTKAVAVTLKLLQSDPRIKPGFSAKAEIIVAEVKDALQVPLSAIRTAGGKSFVALVRGTTMEQVEVQVGLTTTEVAQILSGLQEGDRVLAVNATTRQTQTQQRNVPLAPFGFPGR
ncbi:MAG: efflux RND transporter periplasmic adaptor subunit [Candidatus Bipolaricaulota bacterium]|nr:efflux RND transporter periplasmic adaptor subunit [Candidatus Bipolaricaulota bacterium]